MALAAGPAFAARDQIRIVGSSTVYPFTTAVAEQFGKTSGMKTPVVESTGTGGGFKLFCAGVGEDSPDFTNASRAIKKGEFEDCAKNGVTEIVEIKIGFDGLSLAQSKAAPDLNLTKQQIFLALAKEVPDKDGKLVANPYKMWSDIDPSLPAEKIEVLGPPPTSGTRDSFVELVMEKGAEKFESLAELKKSDAKAFEAVWKSIREDGAYRRGRRERQPDRPEAAGQSQCARHLRLLLPRGERRRPSRASPIDGVRADLRDDRRRQLQGGPSALRLRQEAACRRRSPA